MKKSQLFSFITLEAVFWLIAALIVRFFGDTVFYENSVSLIIFYFLAVTITLLSMYLTKLLSGRRFNELLDPVVTMTTTATFLDAIALTWFRQLYSQSFEVALHGAAWILWGVGLGLLFTYYLSRKKAI